MPRYRPNPQDNPEKPGGEGWLVNDQQQLACQFKPDSFAIRPWSVGVSAHLQLDTAPVAGAADPKADAAP